jgi:hypothetical protein
MGDPGFIAMMAIIATGAYVATLWFIRRMIELRHERLTRTPPESIAALSQRLDRIENALETTALEVERIAEASRFMSKLLAERGVTPSPSRPLPERVITPH